MKNLSILKKLLLAFMCTGLTALVSHAGILLKDSLNYPYTNGCIEGQGQWFCYTPASPYLDAFVTNNVLILNTTNHDSVATPTNGFYNATNGTATFATFTINVSQIPTSTNGNYIFDFKATGSSFVGTVFLNTAYTVVPGTYRLGIANFATDFRATGTIDYPEDLAPGVTYTVVVAYDTDPYSAITGSTLWVNPSVQDIQNAYSGDTEGSGFVYGTDSTALTNLLNIQIAQVAFGPYSGVEGISNVIVGTSYTDVMTTNPPVFGISPASTTNYSGNPVELFSAASGVDLAYQWYGPSGALTDDGVNTIGSTSNILVLNNLTGPEQGTYYVVATDAYGNTATSSNAFTTVITTPTPVFFATNVVASKLTNNLFTSTGFTNIALGTGPITYQWYFEPTTTNTPPGENTNTYYPLSGQTSASLIEFLSDYTYAGNYYVVAANSIGGGSLAYGPTNTLVELAPTVATLANLHAFEIATVQAQGSAALKGHTVFINTNNVSVSGYVTAYNGFGSGTYSEFMIQDASGYGAEVYVSVGAPSGYGNVYTPPIGSYVTVTAPVELYNTTLELAPSSLASMVIVTNPTPAFTISPVLENANFNLLATNGLGTNALLLSMAMVTFTNCYIYGSPTNYLYSTNSGFGTDGAHSGVGGIFLSNSYDFLYFTVGSPFSTNPATFNTNSIEIYQFGYSYPAATNVPNSQFYNQPIPTHVAQLTGVYEAYNGGSEVLPSRLADYVINPPAAFSTTVTNSKKTLTLSWPQQVGSTYSVASTTNLAGPWTNAAYGLGYYPTNATFTASNNAAVRFFKVTNP